MNIFDDYIVTVCGNISQNLVELNSARNSFQDFPNKKRSFFVNNKNKRITKAFLENVLELIRAFALKIYSEVKEDATICSDDIKNALVYTFSKQDYIFLKNFYKRLFAIASEYTLNGESLSSNEIFVYEFLYKIKSFAKAEFALTVFENIDRIIPQSNLTLEYREKLADKLENSKYYSSPEGDVYYISKTKPFFVNDKIYYELTVKPASEAFGKFSKFTVFSKYSVPSYYAVRLNFFFSSINVSGREMRIRILDSFKVAIRLIEIDDLASILNNPYETIDTGEYDAIMDYLTISGESLLDIVDLSEDNYIKLKSTVLNNVTYPVIFNLLDKCRDMCLKRKSGYVTLRYAILKLRHRVMRNIISEEQNRFLSDLYLNIKCLPFENTPFDSSLPEHTPNIFDLFLCLNKNKHKCELLSRKVKFNTESGIMYTPVSNLKEFDNVKELAVRFNMNLPQNHFEERKLIIDSGNIFINGYVSDTFEILKSLYRFVGNGIPDYSNILSDCLSNDYQIDSDEKAEILSNIFLQNRVATVFGSAGTGKTVLMNHVAHVFEGASKLFLAKTNSAVEYIRANITSKNCVFKTVDSYLHSEDKNYDILFVDECPTIDNASMRKVLNKISCKAIVLVGDLFQIQSIRYGNWFGLCKYILPTNAVFELNIPYRTSNLELVDLFDKVRQLDSNLFDLINEFRSDFDDSLFYKEENDETLLCFDYDGLYGINNLNSFLQNSNAYVPESWDSFFYKYGDPIIFADNNHYSSVLHKNLKGKILGINKTYSKITFKLEVFDIIDKEKAEEMGLEVLDCENNNHSIITLSIDKYIENPLRERTNFYCVPFQLAYAVSIYKVQGMEFDSVKLVITDESIRYITHNILYTAVTRAKKKLKIYCSESTLKKLVSTIKPVDSYKTALSFAKYNDLMIQKKIKNKK